MDQAERSYEDGTRQDKTCTTRRVDFSQARSRQVLETDVARLSARVEQLEAELADSHEQAAKLERFAAMAAHEVLKPLVMTEAFATMIAERGGHGLDLDTRRDVDTLIRISSRMRLLVEAMLMDARPGPDPMKLASVDTGEILADCVDMLGAEIRAREVKIDVAPMPVVPGDAALLARRVRQPALQRAPVRAALGRRDPRLRRALGRRLDVLGRQPRARRSPSATASASSSRGSAAGASAARAASASASRSSARWSSATAGRWASRRRTGSGNQFFFTLPA